MKQNMAPHHISTYVLCSDPFKKERTKHHAEKFHSSRMK